MAARPPRANRMVGVPAPDRRFRRSRARGEQTGSRVWLQRAARGARIGLLVGGAVWAGVFAWTVVTASAWFSVQQINVHGAARLSTGEVTMLLDGLYGSNVVVTALEPWRERLLGSPWVKDVSLRRVLPDAVDVVIDERVPVAIARSGRSLQLVDTDGVVIDDYGPRYAALDLPILEGWTPSPLPTGRAAGDAAAEGTGSGTDGEAPAAAVVDDRTALAIAVLRDLADAGLLWRVSQIDVSRPHDAVAMLNDDPTRLHLGDEAFATRLQSYLDMVRRLQSLAADLEYVDLRFDDRVYIRPRRAGTTFTPVALPGSAEAQDGADPAADDPGFDVIPDDVTGQE